MPAAASAGGVRDATDNDESEARSTTANRDSALESPSHPRALPGREGHREKCERLSEKQ